MRMWGQPCRGFKQNWPSINGKQRRNTSSPLRLGLRQDGVVQTGRHAPRMCIHQTRKPSRAQQVSSPFRLRLGQDGVVQAISKRNKNALRCSKQ